jgi:nitrite reductase (NADH) large subunit
MAEREKLVIVGGGMAAMRLLEELDARGCFSRSLFAGHLGALLTETLGNGRCVASGPLSHGERDQGEGVCVIDVEGACLTESPHPLTPTLSPWERESDRAAGEVEHSFSHRFDITVIGAETRPAYNRILLSPLLSGEMAWEDVCLKPAEWYAERGIALVLGDAVTTLNPDAKTVTLASGACVSFDRCVLATGSAPILLPIPGNTLPGVRTFRDVADVEAMTAATAGGAPAVVIGGGLLGIEAAYGLARRGVPVTLIHIMDRLMERQLDAEAAALLKKAIESKSITVLLEAQTAEIVGETRVEAVRLKDGRELPCALVVMAAGVRPDASLARAAGLFVERGVLVDDRLSTSHADIHAIGECVQHRGACYGLVEPCYQQAAVLADVLTGTLSDYPGTVVSTNLKVSGVPVFSAGDVEGVGAETIIYRDSALPAYRKLVLREGRLAGAVLYGDTADSHWYLDLIREGRPVHDIRPHLPFGQAHAEAA